MNILLISAIGFELGTGHFKRSSRFIDYLGMDSLEKKFFHVVINPDKLNLFYEEKNKNLTLINVVDKNELLSFFYNLKQSINSIIIDIGGPSINLEKELMYSIFFDSKITILDDSYEYKHIKEANIICQDIFHDINKKNIYTGLSYSLISPVKLPRLRKEVKNISIFLGGTDILKISQKLFNVL